MILIVREKYKSFRETAELCEGLHPVKNNKFSNKPKKLFSKITWSLWWCFSTFEPSKYTLRKSVSLIPHIACKQFCLLFRQLDRFLSNFHQRNLTNRRNNNCVVNSRCYESVCRIYQSDAFWRRIITELNGDFSRKTRKRQWHNSCTSTDPAQVRILFQTYSHHRNVDRCFSIIW